MTNLRKEAKKNKKVNSMNKLYLTNTKSRTLQEVKPLHGKHINLYVCGITPYDYTHLGHGRCYVTFDVLFRVLSMLGFDVTYARNFTDIEDKLLKKAHDTLGDEARYTEIASTYINSFHDTMHKLGCKAPNHEPRVTDNIPSIITFIESLIAKKHAYVIDGDVYFDITSFKEYGALSGRNLEDLEAGARVKVDENKKNPGDFALWKSAEANTFWSSPWGWGRPGWHIECSALAQKYLGDSIDIHGGGQDLIFPHHENEIAQSESRTGKEFAKIWVHNAFVTINHEKMSKSLGNTFFLHELFKEFNPMVIRYYYLQHHYRTPIDFSDVGLKGALSAYKRLVQAFSDVHATQASNALVDAMRDALLHDLNTPKAIGIIFEHLEQILHDKALASSVKYFIQNILGLRLEPLEHVTMTPEIEQLLAEREQARAAKNWKRADEIRDRLKELGFNVQDSKIS
jgi:cysteinyl-tRNA synthetase